MEITVIHYPPATEYMSRTCLTGIINLKGTIKNHERHNVKRWVLIVAGGVDGLIILLLVGGFGYWLVKRRSHSLHSRAGNT